MRHTRFKPSHPPMASSAAIRNDVLRSYSATSTTRVAQSGITRKDTVYIIPRTATAAERSAWFAHLILRGTSTDQSLAEWRSFILSVVAAAFPDLGTKVTRDSPRNYEEVALSTNQLRALVEFRDVTAAWAETPATDVEGLDQARMVARQGFLDLPSLPAVTSDNMSAEIESCMAVEALYGYTSLVLFLAGKTISDQNRGAITTRRPLAVERKYGLGSVPCLTGNLRLSDVAHTSINVGFATMNHARMRIFEEVSKFGTETGDIGVEVAAVTTRLMAYSGMQHVIIIDKFLSAHPDADNHPVLASSMVSYASSLRELEKASVEHRPFFKLIHGDTTRAFNRKDVEALMVVAISAEAEVNPTLSNYNLPENSDEILAAYNRIQA